MAFSGGEECERNGILNKRLEGGEEEMVAGEGFGMVVELLGNKGWKCEKAS